MPEHFHFNDATQYGNLLRRALQTNEEADDRLADIRDLMIQMRGDNDGSQDAHYATIKDRFGFASDAAARAAFNEIDSAYSKTSGNAAVSNVRAARDQIYSKFRG